jgi:hypothetical protein
MPPARFAAGSSSARGPFPPSATLSSQGYGSVNHDRIPFFLLAPNHDVHQSSPSRRPGPSAPGVTTARSLHPRTPAPIAPSAAPIPMPPAGFAGPCRLPSRGPGRYLTVSRSACAISSRNPRPARPSAAPCHPPVPQAACVVGRGFAILPPVSQPPILPSVLPSPSGPEATSPLKRPRDQPVPGRFAKPPIRSEARAASSIRSRRHPLAAGVSPHHPSAPRPAQPARSTAGAIRWRLGLPTSPIRFKARAASSIRSRFVSSGGPGVLRRPVRSAAQIARPPVSSAGSPAVVEAIGRPGPPYAARPLRGRLTFCARALSTIRHSVKPG